MDGQFVSIGNAAKMLGMSIDGLRKWASAGILLPVRTLSNQRRYRVADLRALMGEDPSPAARDTRVSTRKQPEAGTLDRQPGRLTSFAAEPQGTVIAALPDVARG
ncbi:MAG: MerR family DNA-binding transcriptional regulator, partial [Thermaerobacter sp.]|nr:MerR family DNA-binding transcriptional regulator [Thermaerobacter sp.]